MAVLGKKKGGADFGPKLQILKWRSGTCDTRSRPPLLSLWLILCVVVPHTHTQHPPKLWLNPKHHHGAVIFPHFAHACCLLLAACLLLACCLLLAKLVRSTLDTKEGYKNKTGSTSSVTLTLTLALTLVTKAAMNEIWGAQTKNRPYLALRGSKCDFERS